MSSTDDQHRNVTDLTDPEQVGSKLAAYNRRKLAQGVERGTALGQLQLNMLAAFEEYDRARRAERIAAGADPDDDRDPFETPRWIADKWAESADKPDMRAALIGTLVESLTLDDIRVLRTAADAAAEVSPRLMVEHADRGMKPNRIADELAVSPSYVYRVLREQRAAEQAGGHEWHHPTPSAGLRCRRCDLAHKHWSGEDCPDRAQ